MRLRKCISCKKYTLKEICSNCGQRTILPYPPKYSPQDKFGKFRRVALKELESKS